MAQYLLTTNQLIREALLCINAYQSEDSIPGDEYSTATTSLYLLIKSWQKDGHLWAKTQATLFLQVGQNQYSLGDGSTDYCSTADGVISTALSVAAAMSATTLNLNSSAGITIGDFIGIVISGTQLFWTTVATIPNSTSVTITTGLPAAAAQGALVYDFTNKIPRPLTVPKARRWTYGNETPLNFYSYDEYYDLPNKLSAGSPTTFMYDPQLILGKLALWPTPNNVTDYTNFTFFRPLTLPANPTSTLDFPEEWQLALILNLGLKLAPKFDKKDADLVEVNKQAAQALANAMAFDNENGSIYFQANTYGRG